MSQDAVHECASPEEAARLLLSVYGTKDYKVVGNNIVEKAHREEHPGYVPHITRAVTDPGEPGPAPIEQPLAFTADTVSLVIGGQRTDYRLGGKSTKDVFTGAPQGGNPTGFAPIQRGVGNVGEDEDEELEEQRLDQTEEERQEAHNETSGQIVVPAMRQTIKSESTPRGQRAAQGKADAGSAGAPKAPDAGRGNSSDVRSIPEERHRQLRLGSWENALANLLRQHFDRQERVVKTKFTGAKLRDRWDSSLAKLAPEEKADVPNPGASVTKPVDAKHIFDKDTWKDALKDDSSGMLRAVWDDLGQDAADTYGVDWTLQTPDIDSAIGTQLDGLLYVEDTTEKDLEAALTRSWEDRKSASETEDELSSVFENARENRAPLIAQQQTTSAGNGAIQSIGEQNPDQFQSKTWRGQMDDRERPSHVDAEGQTVPIDQAFQVGDDMLMFPGDPSGSLQETVNCRCFSVLSPNSITPWQGPSDEGPVLDLTKVVSYRRHTLHAPSEVKLAQK